ncbi:hypothetical protein [Streptomyces sp. NPDC059122]|uniref:hypothetical protein n=1 Tax=Streptomyces sp. NPDC059122 TaxID=3346732 RepID=UPI00367AA6E1
MTQSASAAAGTLIINGNTFQNPTGCNVSDTPGDPDGLVSNGIDHLAFVYSDPFCEEFVGTAMQLSIVVVPHAWSVAYY